MELFLKPGTSILKVHFLCINNVISLLIHSFLPVNARLLIAFGTAFYAIYSYSYGPGYMTNVHRV